MRVWWLLIALLGGCADVPDSGEEPVSVITDPKDFAGSADGSHVHDYWGGEERLTLLTKEDGCQQCTVSYGGDRGAPLGTFRPDPDHIVPPGTAWVHATATWTIEQGDHKDVALYVQTANSTQMQMVGVLEQGETLTFNSTNEDNDPPHHRLSLWLFEVRARSSDGDGTRLSNFHVNLSVVVERGLEIPVFPPHPDHWDGEAEIRLHESTRTVQQIESPTYFTCNGCLGHHPPDDGRIIPPDALEVEVVLEIKRGLPGTLGLMVHGADTWDHEHVAPTERDDLLQRLVWRLPVEGRPDSPYAKHSLWSLYLVNDQPGEVKAWQGEYAITVTAER